MINKTIEFIEKARKVHGDEFDYSKVDYVNARTKVTIISHRIDPMTNSEFGEFEMIPNKHLLGGKHPKYSGKGYTYDELVSYFKRVKCLENGVGMVYYTNEHSKVPKDFFMYRDVQCLMEDIQNNEVKTIYYGATNTKEDKRHKT